ncbi:hypothetical protein, partial [Providencia rettgeri]|uniref:hypothetical protein n=1 Tax=Providencia rettgeri TaxID=587 RepID=UPI001C83C9CA
MNINFPSLLRGSKPNLSYAYALKLLLILANILIGSIAPSISFQLSIMIFYCLRRKEKSLCIINIFSLSFFAAVTYSSRAFLLIESDDYIRYYDSYINASNLNKAIYFEEPGLLWFYDIIHLISPSLTSSG